MDEDVSSCRGDHGQATQGMEPNQETAMTPRCYRIVVAGELSGRFAPAFDGMSVQCSGGQTEITGMVVDQSQLHGLLNRVGEFGLDLVGVNAVVDQDPRAGPQLGPGETAGSEPA
jgi:hypothetical protein